MKSELRLVLPVMLIDRDDCWCAPVNWNQELQGKKQRREKKTLSLLGAADGERSMIKITRVIRMKNEEGF